MRKKWPLAIFLVLVMWGAWQVGAINYLLAKTFFSPDHSPEINKELSGEKKAPQKAAVMESEKKPLIGTEELTYTIEIFARDLEIPWDIAPLPDGRFLITERPGRVVVLDAGKTSLVHSMEEQVWVQDEGGLLGMAISPEFENNKHVFLYYTYREGNQTLNKVSRFIYKDNALADEKVMLDKIPGNKFHNGGRIRFGPDGKLYITTGDGQKSSGAPDINSMSGKILRINEDGTLPPDNPYPNSPVFASGFRNPQGLAWHPVSKKLFASDHGPTRQDEINLIVPGRNYGWPTATCSEADSRFENPVACYADFTMAPSGMDFLPWDTLSESPLYVAGLRGNMVMRIDIDAGGAVARQEAMMQEWGRIRTVLYHDGALYVLTNNRDGRGIPKGNDDKVLKVTPIQPDSQSARQ